MPVDFTCPHCGARSYVADEFIGRSGPCAKCGQTITVPIPSAEATPFAAAAPANRSGAGMSGFAIALIVVAILGTLFLMVAGVAVALLLPAVQSTREAARRSMCSGHLKQLAVALHNYHDTFNTLPTSVVLDEAGTPQHSWRVAILPYIEQAPVYAQYDREHSWDSAENEPMSAYRIPAYSCPSDHEPPGVETSYLALVGPDLGFEEGRYIPFRDFTDGLSNTILLVEAKQSGVRWYEPQDLTLDQFVAGVTAGTLGPHPGGVNVLFADGTVRFIRQGTPPEILRALATRNGGEAIEGGY